MLCPRLARRGSQFGCEVPLTCGTVLHSCLPSGSAPSPQHIHPPLGNPQLRAKQGQAPVPAPLDYPRLACCSGRQCPSLYNESSNLCYLCVPQTEGFPKNEEIRETSQTHRELDGRNWYLMNQSRDVQSHLKAHRLTLGLAEGTALGGSVNPSEVVKHLQTKVRLRDPKLLSLSRERQLWPLDQGPG